MQPRPGFRRGELRSNRRIRVPEIRLIGSDGKQMGVFITREALKIAENEGLDLVEIVPNSKPPVCKIMDYGKYKYEQSKKKHEAKKHQIIVKTKEIKIRPTTDEHDVETKLKHIKRFLEEGDKVKITLRFRGREIAHKDLAYERMKYISEQIAGLGEVEQYPKMEGRLMSMFLVPGKKKADK